MNNHWHANYRAYQEGPVPFPLRAAGRTSPATDAMCDATATRLAIDLGQPLLVAGAHGATAEAAGRESFSVDGSACLLATFKPSDDGQP